MHSDGCRSWVAIINVIEPSGVHLIKSVMVVLTVKSNEVILKVVDLRLEWDIFKDMFGPICGQKYCEGRKHKKLAWWITSLLSLLEWMSTFFCCCLFEHIL